MAKGDCICRMGPGHTFPNRENYLLDHRCPQHGEKAQPAVWGRHKDLELIVTIAQYEALVAPAISVPELLAALQQVVISAGHEDAKHIARAALAKAVQS